MGFGHRVYKTVDPRQEYLKEMARDLTFGTDDEVFYRLSEDVESFIKTKRFNSKRRLLFGDSLPCARY